MPYVVRNQQGLIIELRDTPTDEGTEWLEAVNSEVLVFVKQQQAKMSLSQSDYAMFRVVEDLIDLLVAKQVLIFTDLPEMAQQKLLQRKQLRQEINALYNLVGEDDAIF